MKKSGSPKGRSPAQLIDARIAELADWRGQMLSRLRSLSKKQTPRSSRSGSGVFRCGRTTG
jgi:hypothetical protein